MTLSVRNLRLLVLSAWCGFFGWLWLSGQVLRYLGPRTSWVVTFGAITLAISTVAYARTSGKSADTQRGVRPLEATALLSLLLPILVAIMFSGSSLGALAAANKLTARGVDLASLAESLSSGAQEVSFLQVRAASDDPDTADSLGIRPGQQVSLTGLVLKANHSPGEPFQLGRFYVTCCIADAIPISVTVYPTLAKGRVGEDDWLEVSGVLAKRDDRLAVDAESINRIEEPANPYLSFR